MSGLASHCMLASLGDEDDLNSRRFTGTAAEPWQQPPGHHRRHRP
jgi:hypothetical protein